MPTVHVRLKPIEWFQEIGHYPQQGGEDRNLRATCTYSCTGQGSGRRTDVRLHDQLRAVKAARSERIERPFFRAFNLSRANAQQKSLGRSNQRKAPEQKLFAGRAYRGLADGYLRLVGRWR